jgi:ubiquinone/menaquinone biosynthesis C-methylase UbiE
MSWYGGVFAWLYDPLLAAGERMGMAARRQALLSAARGSVLEIGAGTGLNLRHYPADLHNLTVTDPEGPMVRRLTDRVSASGRPAEVVPAPAEALPFPDAHFDTVVSTMALCTVADLPRALGEISRVLTRDGQLLLIEHVRSPDANVARWQDRLHRPWRAFAYGCHCNLDLSAALRQAGFDASALHTGRWRGMPSIVQPLLTGRATRAGSAGTHPAG